MPDVVALEEGGHAGPPLHKQSQRGVYESLVVRFSLEGIVKIGIRNVRQIRYEVFANVILRLPTLSKK